MFVSCKGLLAKSFRLNQKGEKHPIPSPDTHDLIFTQTMIETHSTQDSHLMASLTFSHTGKQASAAHAVGNETMDQKLALGTQQGEVDASGP